MTEYSNRLINIFADSTARCFEYTAKVGIDSYTFAKKFMHSKSGYSMLMELDIKPFNSFRYMLEIVQEEIKVGQGVAYDSYVMWMYGYLIKYWTAYRDITPEQIWKILPVDKFNEMFNFYHTQGWNYIIDDATEAYKRSVLNETK